MLHIDLILHDPEQRSRLGAASHRESPSHKNDSIIAVLVGKYGGIWAENTSAGWACVTMAFLFIVVFGASYSSLGWALPPEVFPVSIRSKGVAFSVAINWLSNFTV